MIQIGYLSGLLGRRQNIERMMMLRDMQSHWRAFIPRKCLPQSHNPVHHTHRFALHFSMCPQCHNRLSAANPSRLSQHSRFKQRDKTQTVVAISIPQIAHPKNGFIVALVHPVSLEYGWISEIMTTFPFFEDRFPLVFTRNAY